MQMFRRAAKFVLFWTFSLVAIHSSGQSFFAADAESHQLPSELALGLANEPENTEYQQWFSYWQNQPQLLGEVSYRNEPLLAGESQALTVRFTPGMDLPVGSVLTLMAPWESGISFQAQTTTAPNHVVAVSRGLAQLSPSAVDAPVPFASWYEGNLMLGFEVQQAALTAGEEVEFQVSNLSLPGRAGPLYLPVAFRLPNQKVLMRGPQVELTVRPNRTERVQLIAPSRLGRNQSADVQILLTDRFGNSAIDRLPTLDVLLDGEYFQRVEPTSALTTISGIRFSEPGRHQVEVRTGGGSLRGISNPIVVQSGDKQVRWIDLSPDDPELQTVLTRRSLTAGGSLMQLGAVSGQMPLAIATPFIPTDDRSLDTSIGLVQIASGESQYPWFADRLLQSGYRLGFTAGSYSPLRPVGPNPRTGLTAVLGSPMPAGLEQGATVATTGARMVLHATVNGAEPGRRVSAAKNREVIGWVQGTGPLDRIELVKNGELISSQAIAAKLDSPVLRVSMKSSSAPFRRQRDLPRNGREWIGFIRASSAPLQLLGAPGFRNSVRQAIAQNGGNRVDFITWTHGGASSFMVQLGETSEDEVIELNLRAGQEDSDIEPRLRQPAKIPPARLMIPWYELANGPVTRFVEVAGYQDEIRFELVDPNASDYAEFRFTDVSPFAEEDYYYIKAIQLDDHVAWTSPVFVGGFDSQ